jgi:hypothetical protein
LFVNGFVLDHPQEDFYYRNMLIAYNTDGDCNDGLPYLPSGGHNLDSDGSCAWSAAGDLSDQDPALGPLEDNGGGTWTHALLAPYPSNPAVDRGGTDCPPIDQRGVTRPQELDGDGVPECDIGAYEETEFGFIAIPVEEATPVPTSTPEPAEVKVIKNAFCRKGPGVNYDDLQTVLEGQTAAVEGRDQDGSWWLILHPDGITRCWVSNTTVEASGPVDEAPVQPGLPLPDAPEQFVMANRVCSPNGFSIYMTWESAGSGISGYRLFRNGELIATLKPDRTFYTDEPPLNQFLAYELASYNENGSSDHLIVEDSGCP